MSRTLQPFQILRDLQELKPPLKPALNMLLLWDNAVSEVHRMPPAYPFDSFVNLFQSYRRSFVCIRAFVSRTRFDFKTNPRQGRAAGLTMGFRENEKANTGFRVPPERP